MIPLILAVAIAPDPSGELKTFRDWIVGCDNRYVCHATTLDPESTPEEVETGDDSIADNTLGLAILRGAAAHDAPHIRFLPCYQCTPQNNPDPGSVRSLAVRDKAKKAIFHLELSPRDATRAKGAEGLPISADSALFPALAEGEVVTLDDGANKPLATISLRGVRDTLRHMDENQGRIGNITALVERGNAAAYLVPPKVPQQPVVLPPASALPPTELTGAKLRRLQEQHKCDSSGTRLPEAIYHRLDDRTTMLLLNAVCSPYNGEGFVYVVDNGGKARIASVRFTDSDPLLEAPQVVSAGWDETERRLHSFGRGRAMADCGQQQAFAWDGEQFLLVHEAVMGECRGSIDYIIVYRRSTIEREKWPR